MIKKTFILPVLAVAAIAAGCGSGSSTTSSTYGEPTAAATGTAAPEKTAAPTETPGAVSETAKAPANGSDDAQAGAISVDIANFAFAPNAIQAKVGQKITFTNQDSAPHTATATDGAKFDSGELDQGKSFSYTAKKAGTIKFVCSFHPNMTGTITVSN